MRGNVVFRVLGAVSAAGARDPRQVALAAVLLTEANRPVSVAVLVERAWGDRPPERVRGALADHFAELRAVFAAAGARIVRDQDGYAAIVDPGQVDLHRFRLLVARARGSEDREAAVLYAEAFELWRGRAFGDLTTPWFDGMREQLRQERLAVESDRVDVRLRLGEHRELLPDLFARAVRYPAHERIIGQVMTALWSSGRRDEAIDQFTRIGRDLGVESGSALRAVFHRVLISDPDTPPAAPRLLPGNNGNFRGRLDEFVELDRARVGDRRGPAPVVVITGPAGTGKSALALRWAHRIRGQYPDGALHLDFRGYGPFPPVTPAAALAGFLRVLGVPGDRVPPDFDEAAALYRGLLAGRRVLILVDGVADPTWVRPLLPEGGGSLVVVTSRDRLTSLVTKDSAYRLELGPLLPDDALALLGDMPDADKVAARCGHLPLALRLAAATDSSFMDEEPGLSAAYHALEAESARVFRLVGRIPGPDFGVPLAAALAGIGLVPTRRALDRLVCARLLTRPARDRYGCPDEIRRYAHDLGGEPDGPDGGTWHALRDWYLELCGDRVGRVDAELPGAVAVATAAVESTAPDIAWRLAEALRGHVEARARVPEWIALGTAGLQAAFRAGDQHAEGRMLLSLSAAHARTGDTAAALRYGTRAVKRFRDLGVPGAARAEPEHTEEVRALLALAAVHSDQGNARRSRGYLTRAVRLAPHVSPDAAARARADLAALLLDLGEPAAATGHATRSLEPPDAPAGSRADALSVRAAAHRIVGSHRAALADSAAALALRPDHPGAEAEHARALSAVHPGAVAVVQAADHAERAVALARRTHPRDLVVALLALGEVRLRQGADALACLAEALAVARASAGPGLLARAHVGLARALTAHGDPRGAVHATQALRLASDLRHKYVEYAAHLALADARPDADGHAGHTVVAGRLAARWGYASPAREHRR